MRISTAATAAAILTLLAPLPASADQDAVHECGQIADEQERLACYDAFALEPGSEAEEAAPAADDQAEAIRVAVDRAVASALLDPMSARDYYVSGVVPCERISKRVAEKVEVTDCICWQVNAKNRMGGYVGKQLHFGIYVSELAPELHYVMEAGRVRSSDGVNACYESLRPRSADHIHAQSR